MKLFKLEGEGSKKIDIIPFKAGKGNPFADKGEEHYERTFYTHKGIGPNNANVICTARTFGTKCFICQYRDKLSKKRNVDEDDVKALGTSERQLFLIIDHDNKEDGVQLWHMSHHLFGKLLDEMIREADEEDDWDLFYDAKEGQTLKIYFAQDKYGGRKFSKVNSIHFRPRKPLSSKILKKAVCLDDVLKKPTYEEIKKLFLQLDEEDSMAKRSKKKKSKKEEDSELEESEVDSDADDSDVDSDVDSDTDDSDADSDVDSDADDSDADSDTDDSDVDSDADDSDSDADSDADDSDEDDSDVDDSDEDDSEEEKPKKRSSKSKSSKKKKK